MIHTWNKNGMAAEGKSVSNYDFLKENERQIETQIH